MHVLIAPGSMGPAITAVEAAGLLAAPWRDAGHTAQEVPMSTGAEGLIDAVSAARGGRSHPVPVLDGTAVVEMLCRDDVAYIEPESALAATVDPRSEMRASAPLVGNTAPVAEALLAARQTGARRIVVGLGASAVHDGGTGLLGELARAAGYPGEVSTRALEAIRSQWFAITLEVAAATDLELIGLHGAGAELAGRPGWDAESAQRVEAEVGARASAWERAAASSHRRDLLTNPMRQARAPHSGAGGGAVFALALLGGHVRDGGSVVAEEAGLDAAAADADLILTAAEILDGDAMAQGIPAAVGGCALRNALPLVALAWEILTTRMDEAVAGVTNSYPVLDPRLSGPSRERPVPPEDRAALSRRAARIVKTWAQ